MSSRARLIDVTTELLASFNQEDRSPRELATLIVDRLNEIWDDADPSAYFFNGVHLSNITAGHMKQLREIYTAAEMKPLEEAFRRYSGEL